VETIVVVSKITLGSVLKFAFKNQILASSYLEAGIFEHIFLDSDKF
jgi:hypothetical protein